LLLNGQFVAGDTILVSLDASGEIRFSS